MEDKKESKSGPMLFWGVTAAVLIFFWWLLIYSHGVAPHHG